MIIRKSNHNTYLFGLILIFSLCVSAISFSQVFAGEKEDTLRKETVAAMRDMATIRWTPSKDLRYWNPDYTTVFFREGTTYEGIPYTQAHRETPLDLFKENLDGDGRYTGPESYIGTDCSSSVSLAWRKIDPELPYLSSFYMFPGMGDVVTVGDYRVTSMESTPQILQDNGEEKIRAAYDLLKPGDVLLFCANRDGHVRMVSRTDPENKTVYTIEQTGVDNKGNFKGGNSTWRVDYGYHYDDLIKTNYIPITHKGLLD